LLCVLSFVYSVFRSLTGVLHSFSPCLSPFLPLSYSFSLSPLPRAPFLPQIILAGSFAFDIVDRLSGGSLNIVVPNWIDQYLVFYFISVPFVFWIANITWLLIVSLGLMRLMSQLAASALGMLTLRVKVNRKIDLEKLAEYLKTKAVNVTDSSVQTSSETKKLAWEETDSKLWMKCPPSIELQIDNKYGFLLSVYFQIDSKLTKMREVEMMEIFNSEMKKAEVYGAYDEKVDGLSRRMSLVKPKEKSDDDDDDDDKGDGDDEKGGGGENDAGGGDTKGGKED